MQVDIIPDSEVIEHLDFGAVLGCEYPSHDGQLNGCIAGTAAEFFVVKPCCSNNPLICAGGAAGFHAVPSFTCLRCGYGFIPTECRVVPLASIT